MSIPRVFDTCRPRTDVLEGRFAAADFAADLAHVIVGEGSGEYLDPAPLLRQHLSHKGPQEPTHRKHPLRVLMALRILLTVARTRHRLSHKTESDRPRELSGY